LLASGGILVLGLVLGQFGELFRLPEWLQATSPFYHSSAVPVEDVDVAAAIVLVVIAAASVALSSVLLRRRDITV
jgi:ABC-2 type transport system permease protein